MALPEKVVAFFTPVLIIACAGAALPYEYQVDIAIFCITAIFGFALVQYIEFRRIVYLLETDKNQDEVDNYFE